MAPRVRSLLPISIIYHVLHTNNPVVLHDAARPGAFAKDAYLLGTQAPVGALHSR